MLVKDSEQLQKDRFYKAVDTDNQRIKEGLENKFAGAKLIGGENDPTNPAHRVGKGYMSDELITRLKMLSPYLYFERHPDKHKMWVMYNTSQGRKRYICAFEAGLVPERTIMAKHTEQDVDPSTLGMDWKAPKRNPDNPNETPGLKSYAQPWEITRMGWRTLLLRIHAHGLATVSKIEAAFGADNTPEWAAKMGHQDEALARF